MIRQIRDKINECGTVNQSGSANECGTAMVELTIVAPLLLLLSLCFYDITETVRLHGVAQQLARETVRQAGSTPYLEAGTFKISFNDEWSCQSQGQGCDSTKQGELLGRLKDSLVAYANSKDIDLKKSYIISSFDNNVNQQTIQATVVMHYRGLVRPFTNKDVIASYWGPYM